MRFRKGTKVEVLKRNNFPPGAWHSGEIINGNGHTYAIRYDNCSSKQQAVFERVCRKDIRPLPPSLGASENWISGDIVEVFDENSWKMALILKILKNNYFVVKVLGFIQELEAHCSCIRSRLSWKGDTWVVIGKVSRNFEQYEHSVPTLHLKQISSSSPNYKNAYIRNKKRETVETKRPRENGVGLPSVKKKPSGVTEMDATRVKGNNALLEVDDANTITSSVDSCSTYGNESYSDIYKRIWSSGDAESFIHPVENEERTFYRKGKLESEIHDLELHAYRCTMEALHSSGPLSWDQEALITNLRLSLNISNDEHLTEVRDLISTNICISIG